MIQRLTISFLMVVGSVCMYLNAQTNLYTGTQNRMVVFARFNDDPEMDTPRTTFESMFNGEDHSLKSYFKAISNGQLTVNSYLYPLNQGEGNTSFELKYCYYCYDSSWKGSYPNCKGEDITTSADINIGFIIKELAEKLESSEQLPEANELDSDNDGYVDNFVIVLRGAGRGPGKGIYTPQVGTVSEVFTKAHGPILLKGKTVRNYTITFERNSLETHCRFLLSYMGFPALYRAQGSYPRCVGVWDPMDGPHLSYPLVYNRMKYTNNKWISDIPQITEAGEYTLSSADSPGNNAYKIGSPDEHQYWVLEYRDNTVAWENTLPEKGLLIYRVDTRYSGAITKNTEIYISHKDGTPTVSGDVAEAAFSDANGRTAFNVSTNPYPFFTDGSTFDDLDISDIAITGDKITFRINKLPTGIQNTDTEGWNIYVAPGSRTLLLKGEGIEEAGLFDLSGRQLNIFSTVGQDAIDLSGFSAGIYIVRLKDAVKEQVYKLVLK
ncbi:T9SS type A sorting domain-containing protein [Bacteroides sp.]